MHDWSMGNSCHDYGGGFTERFASSKEGDKFKFKFKFKCMLNFKSEISVSDCESASGIYMAKRPVDQADLDRYSASHKSWLQSLKKHSMGNGL